MRLYIDGKEIDCVGLPGATKETSIPRTADRTYYFTPDDETVEIIIQTSNFVHKEGCQPPIFRLGTQQNIIKTERNHQFISFIIIGCLFMAFLYHLALFLLNRRRKAVLVFSVCCLLLLLVSNKLVPLFFENYNWFLAFRLEYIVHFLTFAMLVLLLRTMYQALIHKIAAYGYYALSGLFILSTFIFDSVIYSNLLIYYDITSVLMILYVLVRLAMGIKGGKLQNALSFIGVLALCIFGVNDIMYHNSIIVLTTFAGQVFTAPIGMVFFVLCFAMVISLDIAENERKMLEGERQIHEIQERYNALLAEHSAEIEPPKSIDLSDFGLSAREMDVAWLLIDGKPRKEIAVILDLSINTVNTYCRRIFDKTNSSGVKELYKNLGIMQTKQN